MRILWTNAGRLFLCTILVLSQRFMKTTQVPVIGSMVFPKNKPVLINPSMYLKLYSASRRPLRRMSADNCLCYSWKVPRIWKVQSACHIWIPQLPSDSKLFACLHNSLSKATSSVYCASETVPPAGRPGRAFFVRLLCSLEVF